MSISDDSVSLLKAFGFGTALALGDGQVFTVDCVVRVVPGKRLVCAGHWQGKRVYAKLFTGDQAKRHAERDATGVKALAAANILTPALLAHLHLTHQQPGGQSAQAEVLIFAAIADAANAEATWAILDKKSQFDLAKKLALTVAEHHNAGLIQTDLYLKNFLVQGKNIYTLDGDGIRKYPTITPKQAQQNLCALLSKFDVLDLEAWLADLLKIYMAARTATLNLDLAKTKQATHRHRLKAVSAYADNKVFRQCTDVNVDRRLDFSAVASEFAALDLPQRAPVYDALIEAGKMLKNGNTCTVALVESGAKKIVLKRYNIKNFSHFLSRMWRPSRAADSWANAHRMQILALPTARPIALLETRHGGLRGKAYFLAEYIDAPDLAEFFATNKAQRDNEINANAITLMVQLLYRLFLLQISHGDMKATNIKIVDSQPQLIDLDSMRQYRMAYFARQAHARDLKRFMQNWQAEPALYNAFIKVFKMVYADHAPLYAAKILH